MQRLDSARTQIVLVVGADDRLLGTITDGDIRRAILRQDDLHAPVAQVMNPNPVTARSADGIAVLVARMRDRNVHQLPILGPDGRIEALELLDDLTASPRGERARDNVAVIMAGGLGTRLRPLTDTTPKPLLDIGGKPLLETSIGSLAAHGFRRLYVSVNYRADQIEAYFGDGAERGLEIGYLREDEFLGTAGALSLLPAVPESPLLVMNGDILTRLDFGQLMDFHTAEGAELTMCICQISTRVPYGVVDLDENRVVTITEKPERQHFVNAGIYVVAPALVAGLARGRHLDMTELAQEVGARGGTVVAFPIREYWLDIGQPADYEKAQQDYARVFAGVGP